VFPYPHRETAEYRVGSKLRDRPDGDVLSLGQYHTVEAGEEARPTRAVDPRGAPHYQLHTPHLIKVLSLFLRHLGALPPPRSLPLDITPNVVWKESVKGNEGCVWSKMQLFQCPTLYVPFSLPLLLPPSLSLPPLPHDTPGHVRSRAHSIVCRLTCLFFPAVRVMDKVLSHFGAGQSAESMSRSTLKSTNPAIPAHFLQRSLINS